MKFFYEQEMCNLSSQEMEDKARIRELIEYERYCRDYGLFEQQKECWFEDASVFATWYKGPIQGFLSHSSGGKLSPAMHKINNTVVWLNGNKAVAECMCTLNFREELQGELVDLQCYMRLHFRAEKRAGRWGLLYFEGIYEKDRIDPVFLDNRFSVPKEKLTQFRAINWNMCYRIAEQNHDAFAGGLSNADTWAGADKPETIERLYRESSEWFWSE